MWMVVSACGTLRGSAIGRAQPPEEDVRGGPFAVEARDVSVLRRDEYDTAWMLCRIRRAGSMACASAAKIDAAMMQPFLVHRLGNGRQFADREDQTKRDERQLTVEQDGAVNRRQRTEFFDDAIGFRHERAAKQLAERRIAA